MEHCVASPFGQLCWDTIVTNINWTFVINLVQFLLLVWLLNRIIYRPLIRFMDAREARLSAQVKEAEQQRAEAQNMKEQRASELRQVNLQARQTLEQARHEAANERARIRLEAQNQAQDIVLAAQRQAQTQLEPIRQELERQIEQLAQVAAARVKGRRTGGQA